MLHYQLLDYQLLDHQLRKISCWDISCWIISCRQSAAVNDQLLYISCRLYATETAAESRDNHCCWPSAVGNQLLASVSCLLLPDPVLSCRVLPSLVSRLKAGGRVNERKDDESNGSRSCLFLNFRKPTHFCRSGLFLGV